MTTEELLALPEDGMRHELIDGAPPLVPPVGDTYHPAPPAVVLRSSLP